MINDWVGRFASSGHHDSMMLNSTQFNHEVARERIRATRRSFPFCMIMIELRGTLDRPKSRVNRHAIQAMSRLLHRHLRMTDHKACLGSGRFGVLLVDTPEMGGRSVVARLAALFESHGLTATMDLRVHDPEGFDHQDGPPGTTSRNRGDEVLLHQELTDQDDPGTPATWLRVDGTVEVTAEDSLVPRPMGRMAIKRTVDLFGASVGLVLTSPLVIAAMIAIKWEDGGSAFYTQIREGKNGRPFRIYKLRSMVMNAELDQAALRRKSHRDGPAFKLHNDPRVTRIGRLLRRTCVDELPQLVNVIKGDMSLVGPRPLPWHESRACNGWQRRRLDIRPGITCYWQVSKHSVTSFDDWMRLDLRYLDQVGLYEDLRLILRTFAVPASGRGSE